MEKIAVQSHGACIYCMYAIMLHYIPVNTKFNYAMCRNNQQN